MGPSQPSKPTSIFLTGFKGEGKTTLLNKIIEYFKFEPLGFVSYAQGNFETGREYYLKSLETDETVKIGTFEGNGRIKVFEESFEGFAAGILEGLKETDRVIVMDELGRFEERCERFKKSVLNLVESGKHVLGVIQKWDSVFLNRILESGNVKIYEVNEVNREELFPVICKFIKNNWNI